MKLTAQQQEARIAILHDMEERFGGKATWSQLHSRGHHYMQVSAAALRGDLRTVMDYHYEITPSGRQALASKGGER
ncbi:hypothetical protein KYK29_10165 [Shinella daejeonensis]|uniref:hypothetical protein n=1 Tax=Shinella daejeonensis TaxID=659017 RepID=UPI0020C754CE|nr:hypothetical protein [Shinella daejeonensis]MCP8895299.1 hypothetical protein [Shinella daejeonensis]